MLLAGAILAGCGGGSGGNSTNSGTSGNSGNQGGGVPAVPSPPQVKTAQSVSEAIAMLETSGQLPRLQRDGGLTGTDANNNGVRDDLDAYINAKNLPADQKQALVQHARAMQAALSVNLADANAVNESSKAITRGVHCIWQRLGNSSADTVMEIKKLTMNTQERVLAYGKYANALNGTIISRPRGNTCEDQ